MKKNPPEDPSKVIINPRPPQRPGHRSETAFQDQVAGPDAVPEPAPESTLEDTEEEKKA